MKYHNQGLKTTESYCLEVPEARRVNYSVGRVVLPPHPVGEPFLALSELLVVCPSRPCSLAGRCITVVLPPHVSCLGVFLPSSLYLWPSSLSVRTPLMLYQDPF